MTNDQVLAPYNISKTTVILIIPFLISWSRLETWSQPTHPLQRKTLHDTFLAYNYSPVSVHQRIDQYDLSLVLLLLFRTIIQHCYWRIFLYPKDSSCVFLPHARLHHDDVTKSGRLARDHPCSYLLQTVENSTNYSCMVFICRWTVLATPLRTTWYGWPVMADTLGLSPALTDQSWLRLTRYGWPVMTYPCWLTRDVRPVLADMLWQTRYG